VPDEILFLAHRIPYPPDKGDKIRSWHFLAHLASRARVHLGCLVDDPDDRQHLPRLERICASVCAVPISPRLRRAASLRGLLTGEPLTFPYCRDRRLAAWVEDRRRSGRLDLAFAYSSGVAPYLAGDGWDCRRVVDFVDLDSEKWRAYAAEAAGPAAWIWHREARLLATAEVAIARWADASLFAAKRDADEFRARPGVPAERVHAIGNGVDLEAFDPSQPWPRPVEGEGPLMVFTGAMDYRANVDAVTWFAKEVLPLVRERHPTARFAIVGARPTRTVRRLASLPGVLVTGRVPDTRPWLAHADLVVAPLRVARGVQNKVLEAMAMARPVLCTPEAAAGVEAVAGRDFTTVLCSSPVLLAEAVVDLLADPARRQASGRAARKQIDRSYTWRFKLVRLNEVLAGALGYTVS
jgi:sugar transferase (PEP-CTERM/EpsH1 system associated)